VGSGMRPPRNPTPRTIFLTTHEAVLTNKQVPSHLSLFGGENIDSLLGGLFGVYRAWVYLVEGAACAV